MSTARRSKQQWRELVAEFEASGLGQQAFAQRKRVKLGTFRSWLYRLRKERASPRFVEVVPGPRVAASSRASVAIVIGRARVEFTEQPSVDYLVEFVRGVDGAAR